MSWQEAFVAMSVVIGDPVEAALEALGEGGSAAAGLVARLRSPSRDARAKGLAGALAAVVVGVDRVRLA